MVTRNSPKTDRTHWRKAKEREKTMQLRLAGATYREIAEAMDCSVSTAKRRCETSLAEIGKQERELLRSLEVDRLDRLQRAVWADAIQGDLPSIDRALKIIDQRSKLLGLNAPTQVDITGGVDIDLDSTVNRIMAVVEAEVQAAIDPVPVLEAGDD